MSDGRRNRLPRTRRITSSDEIRALIQRGKRSRTAHLDVFDFASPVAHPRVGVVVPKHRHNSVERNKLKRRIREVLRLEVLPRLVERQLDVDVLVRTRREAYAASYEQLNDELTDFVERKWSRER